MNDQEKFDGLVQRFFTDRGLAPDQYLRPDMELAEFVIIARVHLYAADFEEFRHYCEQHLRRDTMMTEYVSPLHATYFNLLRTVVYQMARRQIPDAEPRAWEIHEAGIAFAWNHLRTVVGIMACTHEERMRKLIRDHRAHITGNAETDFPGLFSQRASARPVGEIYADMAKNAETVLPRLLEGLVPTAEETRRYIERLEQCLGRPIDLFISTPQARDGEVALMQILKGRQGGDSEESGPRIFQVDWDSGGLNSGRPAFLDTGMRSRQQFANYRLAPSRGKKGRIKSFANKNGAVYPKPRGW